MSGSVRRQGTLTGRAVLAVASLVAAALLTIALLPPAGAHAASWRPPQNVSSPQTTSSCGFFCGNPGAAGVDVAVNSRGDTLMSWARRDDADTVRVQARFRPAGGSFGPVQNL